VDKPGLKKYSNGFQKFREIVDGYTPDRVSDLTGIPVNQLYTAAGILASNHPTAVLWGTDISNAETIAALADLQLLLGNLGQAGGGLNPLRAQSNTQGACDMGCSPQFLPGYQSVSDAQARKKFEHAWDQAIPATPGMNAKEIMGNAGKGNIRLLYIVGEDVLNTSSEAASFRANLEACEFIVLQEMAASETARYADVILPNVSFAEKTGTFTNTERRVQMVNQAIESLGEARPDWRILAELGARVGLDWGYNDPAQIMDEIAALTPVYAGITHDRLRQGEILQWPVDSPNHCGTSILPLGLLSHGEVQWIVPKTIERSIILDS